MPHTCNLNKFASHGTQSFLQEFQETRSRRHIYTFLVSENNPLSAQCFRSEKEIKAEKMRQLEHGYWYIVHPFSSFMRIYDFWLMFLYCLIVIVKPLDAGIRDGGGAHCPIPEDFEYQDRDDLFILFVIISTTIDILSWTDIVMQFFLGYYNEKTNKIELNPKKIAKRYILGPYFIIDVVGSIPRFSLRLFMDDPPLYILGVQNIFCLAKGIKFLLILKILSRIYIYADIKSNTKAVAVYYMLLFSFTLHYVTTLNQAVGRIFRVYFQTGTCEDVISSQQTALSSIYPDWMFRTSAYFLQISLPRSYYKHLYVEEQLLLLLSYSLGKVFVILMWTNLAVSMLATRMVRIRFQKLMTQVEEYLQHKKVPYEIKNKIYAYYHYKYQGKYFKEEFLTFLMSRRLKQEIKLNICRSLIEKVPLFEELSLDDLGEITRVLIPEIILAAETIFTSGTFGDSMYFIYSGTVAVYSFSGVEICHLEDGSYFGEASIVLKLDSRQFTVVAVETCQLYKITRAELEKILWKHKNVQEKLLKHAKSFYKIAKKFDQLRNTIRFAPTT